MKNINKNQILKSGLRHHKKALGILPHVTGKMINSANQAQLLSWYDQAGIDANEVIVHFHAFGEHKTQTPDAPAIEGVVASDPLPAPVVNESADKLADALKDILGNVNGKDAELRQDVESISEKLELLEKALQDINQVKEIFVSTPDLEKVNVGKVHYCFEKLLTVLSCGIHPMLVGPAGSFKTSSAEKAAKALSLDCSAISVCAQTTASALLGYLNATGDYVATEFRKRYETGGVFILDEIDNGNPNVLAVLNSALANGSCAFPDGMVAKHEDFRLVATANTFGTGANAQYVGRNALDAATLDRFFTIEWGYDEQLELSLAPNADCREWTKDVIAYRKAAEDLKVKMVISPRASFEGWKLIAAGMKAEDLEAGLIWRGVKKEIADKVKAGAALKRHEKGGDK
jgi:hypothetical protein